MADSQRDVMFCHACQHEWYRDEFGLICPNSICGSDFTEVLEDRHEPRNQRSASNAVPQDREEAEDQGGWIQVAEGAFRDAFAEDPPMSRLPDQDWQRARRFSRSTGRHEYVSDGVHYTQINQPGFSATISIGGGDHAQGRRDRVFQPIPLPLAFDMWDQPLHPRNPFAPQPAQQQPEPLQTFTDRAALVNNLRNEMRRQGLFFGEEPPPVRAGPRVRPGLPVGALEHFFGHVGLNSPRDLFRGDDAVFSQEALDTVISALMEQHQIGGHGAALPASNDVIERLGTKTIGVEDVDQNTGKVECSICADELQIGATVTNLPCNHWYHKDCIKQWLQEHDSCPHCRKSVTEADREHNAAAEPDQNTAVHRNRTAAAPRWVPVQSERRTAHTPPPNDEPPIRISIPLRRYSSRARDTNSNNPAAAQANRRVSSLLTPSPTSSPGPFNRTNSSIHRHRPHLRPDRRHSSQSNERVRRRGTDEDDTRSVSSGMSNLGSLFGRVREAFSGAGSSVGGNGGNSGGSRRRRRRSGNDAHSETSEEP